MDEYKWKDIGYTFLVGGDGDVYEGRGWNSLGLAPGFNDTFVGISFIGTFNTTLPEKAALKAARRLMCCGVRLGHVSPSYYFYGHRQAQPTVDCPGDRLFEEVSTWPRFRP